MKKTMVKIPLVIFLLSLFTTGICLAQTDYAAITGAKAFINERGRVVVSGNISSGAGNQVDIAIIAPGGGLEYTDSKRSTANGQFAFSYTMTSKTPGTYVARLGGSRVVRPVAVTFYAPVGFKDVSAFLSGNRRVEIDGRITTGANRKIAATVTDPDGRLDYVDSTFSRDDGYFMFSYLFTNPARGTYYVNIGGENIAYPAHTSFSVGCMSNDAALQNLELSTGSLDPAFAPETTAYDADVPLEVDGTAVIPTASDSNAIIKVNGQKVASGYASKEIILDEGDNTIEIVVTAQDGVTTGTYTVNIPRLVSLSGVTAGISPERQVNIDGVISAGAGRVVSVVVTAPNGCSDYVDSTFSAYGGSFHFAYLLSGANGAGTYTVKAGGEKSTRPATTSFVYTPPETGGGGSQLYSIIVEDPAINASQTSAAAGATITLSGLTNGDYYIFYTGTGALYTQIPVPEPPGNCTFVMPAADVTVTAAL